MKTAAGIASCLLALALEAGAAERFAERVPHDLILCATREGAFYIGSKVDTGNGLLRTRDRLKLEHFGFDHPRIDALAVDPTLPQLLFVGASNGAIRSRDGGHTWKIVTGWDVTEIRNVAIDASTHAVYLALPDGIAVSNDGGDVWRRADAGIARKFTQTLAVDRMRAGRILAGTERGIYLSDDGATSWTLVQPTKATVSEVKQSPHRPGLFVAVTQADGAWRSEDGGTTWKPIPAIGAQHTLHDVAFDSRSAGGIALCGWGCGVVVSRDDGVTWTQRLHGLPNDKVWSVAFDPDMPGRIYASPHQTAVFVSDNFGVNWRACWPDPMTVRRFVFVPQRSAQGEGSQ